MEEKKLIIEKEPASRREFLKRSGIALAAGAVSLAACAPAATPTPEKVEVTREIEVTREVEVTRQVEVTSQPAPTEAAQAAPQWPWKYEKLDVEEVRKRGHEGYYRGDCCYGAFVGVVDALRDKVGFPFDTIPSDMMGFGAGGMSGWGTTCGALIGASAAINLVTDKATARKIVSELMGWYTQAPFPSEKANEYAVKHEYLVKEYKSDKELPQSVSDSPLCHISVSKWCVEAGIASGAPERAERCGRLAGDVSARAVELLNANLDAAFSPVFALSEETAGCTSCHAVGEDFSAGNFTNGKMECTDCHEPHKK